MRRITTVLLAGVLLLGACGGSESSDNPKDALIDSIEGLADLDAATVTVSLNSTTETLQAMSGESGEMLPTDVADAILNSSLVFSGAGEGDDAVVRVVVNIDGEESVDLRVVDKVMYVRADVRGLADRFGADTSEIDQAAQEAASFGFDFVGPLLDGEWLALDFGVLQEQFGGQLPTPTGGTDQSLKELEAILRDTAAVSSEGSDDVGDHLVATVPLRETYQRFLEIADIAAQLPPGATLPDASEVPDESIALDVWVDDGQLRQVELDFLQFARMAGEEVPEDVEAFALRLAIEDFDGDIDVPADAIEIDLEKLMQDILGGVMGGGLGAPPAGDGATNDPFCQGLEGQPRQVLKLYKEQCPDLLKS